MLDSFSTSLAMVPKGRVKKLHKISTKSFLASANKTFLISLFTISFNDTFTSASVVAMAEEDVNDEEEKKKLEP